MKYPACVLIFTVIMLLSACSHPDSRLSDIDSYIESNPDSAYTALKAIDRASLSEDDFAYYALLYTQAQVKCHVILHSDSLLSHAYKRYSRLPDGDLKKRVHFYNSEIAFQNKDYPRAMRDALVAYEIAKSTDDYYWWAKSAEMIADIFFYSFNQKQSLIYEIEAIDNYLKSGRIANHRYALADLAVIYLNLKEKNKGEALLDSLRNVVLTEQPLDSNLYNYIGSVYISLTKNNQDIENIGNHISNYISSGYVLSSNDSINVLISKSKKFSNKGDYDSASVMLANARSLVENDNQSGLIMRASYLNAKKAGNYRDEAMYADSLMRRQNRIVAGLINESVACAQRDFYTAKAETQEQISRNKSMRLIIVAGLSCIIILMLIIIYRQKLHARKAELEANASILLSLRKKLDEKDEVVDQLQQQIDDSRNTQQKNVSIIESLFRENGVPSTCSATNISMSRTQIKDAVQSSTISTRNSNDSAHASI